MELPQRSEVAAAPSMLGRVAATLAAIGTGWILVLMFLICADVIGRAAFSAPILGVPEMVQFSIVGIVFLQLPETYRIGGLTRADMLLGSAKHTAPRLGHLLELGFDLVGLVLFTVIVATTWPLMVNAFAYSEFYGSTGVVQIPTGPLKLIIMVGCTMMALQLLVSALRHLGGVLRPASRSAAS
jgi:TRAP-type mannitol/chloroaromatic compound transport system permease small subunit